jgi:signal transduction histidine kinase
MNPFYMTFLIFQIIILYALPQSLSQEHVLSKSMEAGDFKMISLGNLDGWKFTSEDNPVFAHADFDDTAWSNLYSDNSGRVSAPPEQWQGIGWFRITVRTDSTFLKPNAILMPASDGAMEVYINGEIVIRHGNPASTSSEQVIPGIADHAKAVFTFEPNTEYTIAVRYSFAGHRIYQKLSFGYLLRERAFSIDVYDQSRSIFIQQRNNFLGFTLGVAISVLLLVLILHVALHLVSQKDEANIWVVFMTSMFLLISIFNWLPFFLSAVDGLMYALLRGLATVGFFVVVSFTPYVTGKLLGTPIRAWWGHLRWAAVFYFVLLTIFPQLSDIPVIRFVLTVSLFIVVILGCVQALKTSSRQGNMDTWLIAIALLSFPVWYLVGSTFFIFLQVESAYGIPFFQMMINISLPVLFSVYQGKKFIIMHQNMEGLVEVRTRELADKNESLEAANEQIQRQRDEVTIARDSLAESLQTIKATQQQLVQQEKLASLGQLTAGIAHEIKNPLNFVNNFAELSIELIDELSEDIDTMGTELQGQIDNLASGAKSTFSVQHSKLSLNDIKANLLKIHEHGSRADSIVKSMLQHSRGSTGKMEPTALNRLIKEFVNLAYHGMRAGKNPINVDIRYDLDEAIGEVPLIAEDFSRVIVNLCSNAFDACTEVAEVTRSTRSAHVEQPSQYSKLKTQNDSPILTVRSKAEASRVLIEVTDNGPGIPEDIKDKILQPFFTTKKGTLGTGLGLSISNDIIRAHGGTMEIDSQPGNTTFRIILG